MEERSSKRDDAKMKRAGAKTGLDLDTILLEDIGQFGRFQLRTVALCALAVIFSGTASSEFVFTTARINTRCRIPECESYEHNEFSPSWIMSAVPTSGASFDNCRRFANISAEIFANATCSATLFDSNHIVGCEEFVYENTGSVVYTFGLACQEWERSLIGSVRKIGTLVALPITGYASDRWGRRTALAVNAFIRACLGLARSWVNTYVSFTILQFLEPAFGSGVFTSAYILVMELVGPRIRVIGGASMNTFFSVGNIYTGLVAWAVHDWRQLTQILYGPMLIACITFWLLPESVRWYMSKGRYEDAEAVLKTAARFNGTRFSEKSLETLNKVINEEKKIRKSLYEVQKPNETCLISQVIKNKQVLTRCIVSPVWWMTYTFVYFGLSVNAVNISGNRYLNYVAVSAVEIPGYWTSMLLLDKIGRKPVLISAFWICAICQATYVFLPPVMEMVGPRMRVAFGTSMNSFFSVGCVIAGLLAWAFNDWRDLTRVLYIPMFIMSFSLWIVPESVRWYMSKGRYQESETVLKTAARINGKQLSEKSLEALRESVEEEKRKNEMEAEKKTNEPWLIVQVFRHKQILIRCIISPVWWITFTIVYYGLSINVVNISGNRYLNYVAVSAVEVPGYWTSMFLLGIIGRKPVLIAAFWVCASCQAAYVFMPDGYYEASLAVYLIGKFSIAMVSAGLYVYTAELYPTRNRHSLLGYSSMVGRIGSILAPLTPAMGNSTFDELPFVIFGCFALLSGCLVFITPETLGAKFPDSMEEASDIGKKKDDVK